jgi:hypothetical protein
MPWSEAGKGTDKKTDKSASAAFPSPPSSALSAANAAAPKLPENPTNSTFAATVPNITDVSNITKGSNTSLSNPALTSMVSQMAVQAATGPLGPAVLNGGAGVLTTGQGIKVAGVGSFGFNAAQMSAAGIIKPNSEVAVNYALNSGKSLEQAMPNNIFTGQNGITNLSQFINDVGSQTKAAASLLVQGENTLKSSGILTGSEHSTQTAGLIMSTASLGIKATSDFLSSTSPMSSSGLSPQGLANNLTNGMAGSASDLIAGGNFAAGLADKALVALSGIKLGGIDVAAAVKGFASSLYSSVLSAIKPLTANVPQNLNSPPSPADAGGVSSLASAASSAASSVKSAVSSVTASIPGINSASLGGLPGGASSIVNDVSNKVSTPGLSNISDAVKNIAANVNSSSLGSEIAAAKNLVSGGSLAAVAMNGIDPAQLSKLNSLFSAIGHGALNISLPKIASDTFNVAGIKAQSKKLLGDSKIPSPNFGTGTAPEPNVAGIEKLTSLAKAITDEQDNYNKLSNAYQITLAQHGYDSSEAKGALSQVTESAQALESLQTQISKTVII